MKLFINPIKFKHEFESGIGYVGTAWIDNGWERVSLSAYNEKGEPIDYQETKWVKQKSLFAEYKHTRNIIKAEKRIHRALELYYKKKLFYCSIAE